MDDPPGEFALIARLLPHLAAPREDLVVGPGDDAAVVALDGAHVAITVDVLVEGVHFSRDLSGLEDVGWKAIAVNVSDLAAMGARPRAAVVGLTRPRELAVTDVERVYAGMAGACARWDLQLVGGDTVRGEALSLAVTALGTLDGPPVRRDGARAGDRLVLVGSLGGAAAALALHGAGAPVPAAALARHRRPQALVAAGTALRRHGATAMIDVSDGLGADCAHVCKASGVTALLEAGALALDDGVAAAAATLGVDPLDLACGGGEDFAILAAVPPAAAAAAARAAGAAEGVEAAVVGTVRAPGGALVGLRLGDGTVRDITAAGFDHYAGPAGGTPDQEQRKEQR
jgi:thiamine-monophosphate kinase